MPIAITHRRVNHLLTIIVVGMAGYVAVLPYWPSISWFMKYDAPLISTSPESTTRTLQEYPSEPTLVIPSIGLSEMFYEGESVDTVNKGAWRRPNTSKPGSGSNTVLAGHRFAYSSKVFYHLDKVVVDDEIFVYYESEQFKYIVRETKVVPPSEISIESPTEKEQLTLYTCTPLWSSTDRLVVIAERVAYE